jgi:hypothetical protein
MEWKSYPQEKPTEEGNYIVSVLRKKTSGQHISECSAHYDVHANKWYKYDPFDDDYSPKDDITIYVVGWADKMSAFFGVLGT